MKTQNNNLKEYRMKLQYFWVSITMKEFLNGKME